MLLEKILFANSQQEIRKAISHERGEIISIKERKQRWWEKEVVSYAYKSAFLSSIKFYTDAGKSPTEALRLVIEGENNPNLYIELNAALGVIKNGGSFTDALRSMGFLDHVVVSILDSGEKSSNMEAAISMSEEYMREQVENKRKLVSIFTYLGLEFGSAYTGLLYLKLEMIPTFQTELLPKMKDEVARISAENSLTFINIVNDVMIYGFAAIALLMGFVMFYFRYFSNGVETAFSKLPLFSKYTELIDYAISFTLLSFMLKSGTLINNALRICRDAISSPSAIRGLDKIIHGIDNGKKVQQAMANGDFDNPEKIALNSHQNHEQLSVILRAIGIKRKALAVKTYKKINRIGIAILVVASLVVVFEMGYILSVQSDVSDSIMKL